MTAPGRQNFDAAKAAATPTAPPADGSDAIAAMYLSARGVLVRSVRIGAIFLARQRCDRRNKLLAKRMQRSRREVEDVWHAFDIVAVAIVDGVDHVAHFTKRLFGHGGKDAHEEVRGRVGSDVHD